jgi:hypothetical protein
MDNVAYHLKICRITGAGLQDRDNCRCHAQSYSVDNIAQGIDFLEEV